MSNEEIELLRFQNLAGEAIRTMKDRGISEQQISGALRNLEAQYATESKAIDDLAASSK